MSGITYLNDYDLDYGSTKSPSQAQEYQITQYRSILNF